MLTTWSTRTIPTFSLLFVTEDDDAFADECAREHKILLFSRERRMPHRCAAFVIFNAICDDDDFDRREKPIGIGRREPSARGRKRVRAEHVRARAIARHNPRGRRRLLRFGREEIRRFYVWHSGELFGPRGRAIGRSHRRTGEDVNTHEQFVPHGTASDVGAEVSRDVVRR